MRFAEYLSLAQLPELPPARTAANADLWLPPDSEETQTAESNDASTAVDLETDVETSVSQPRLRAPRNWERLLVDASVIGGADRWHRRLNGLVNQLRVEEQGPDLDDVRAASLEREIDQLEALKEFALPLIEELSSLPTAETWSEWLARLTELSGRALKDPRSVLRALAQLAPMGAVGPVGLDQVLDVLSELLLEAPRSPEGQRYGKVYVAPVDAVRGLSFDVVFVPGLAERKFPRKIVEEPLLLDEARARLDSFLATNQVRLENERLALALAVDAASERVVLSYPRIDLDTARPQVPSFYALEAVRSSEGLLPDFAELTRRAEEDASSRLGWPAPDDPEAAIDNAEYDLAMLSRLLRAPTTIEAGSARYLLDANPHLARALRSRFQRWSKTWTTADGLLRSEPAVRAILASQLPDARGYSPTALQSFASCPYRFLLKAIHGLAPCQTVTPLDELDPLQRGALIHDVQFSLFERLKAINILPIAPSNLARAHSELDDVFDRIASEYRDRLAPAIDKVWISQIAAIRTDLREWLRRASIDTSGFRPIHFELAFGLSRAGLADRSSDPASVPDPVRLDAGLLLRGSIDLVERNPSGLVRITDHKTGKADVGADQVINGGRTLQPVLYSLAAEKLLGPENTVTGGRLYFSTSRGGFAEVMVTLDDEARDAAQQFTQTVKAAIERPFLPAAPAKGECERCDYRAVCGPYEALRTGRKAQDVLGPISQLRNHR